MLECKYGELKATEILEEKTQILEVQGELILPEGYPDIGRTLSYQGYLNGLISEYAGGTLSLYGLVETHLVYHWGQPQEQTGVCGFVWKGEEAIVIEERIPLPPTRAEWSWEVALSLFHLEPITARKVKYSGELEIRLTAREERKITLVSAVKTESETDLVTEELTTEEFIASLQTTKEVNNEYQVSYPKAPILRVLDAQVNPVGVRATASKGRVTVEGNLITTLLYISRGAEGEEGGLAAVTWNEENKGLTYFQIVFDLPSASAEQMAMPRVWVESIRVESSHPESCRLQVLLGARVELSQIRSVSAVLDLSTKTREEVDILRRSVDLEEIVGVSEKSLIVEKILPSPVEGANFADLLVVAPGPPLVVDCRPDLDRIFIEGEIDLSLLYSVAQEEGEPRFEMTTWSKKTGERVSFGEILDLPGVEENMMVLANLGTEEFRIEVDSEGVFRLYMVLKACIQMRRRRSLQVVEDCALIASATPSRPGMLFYLVQGGDTLWRIARRYNMTMEAIASANGIADPGEALVRGSKLLIPKTPRR